MEQPAAIRLEHRPAGPNGTLQATLAVKGEQVQVRGHARAEHPAGVDVGAAAAHPEPLPGQGHALVGGDARGLQPPGARLQARDHQFRQQGGNNHEQQAGAEHRRAGARPADPGRLHGDDLAPVVEQPQGDDAAEQGGHGQQVEQPARQGAEHVAEGAAQAVAAPAHVLQLGDQLEQAEQHGEHGQDEQAGSQEGPADVTVQGSHDRRHRASHRPLSRSRQTSSRIWPQNTPGSTPIAPWATSFLAMALTL